MRLFASLYERRVRGFRVVNFAAVIVLVTMMFGLYWAKTRASVDGSSIARADRQIAAEKKDIRLLEARVIGLEQPERIGQLSEDYLHLGPIKTPQEAQVGQLSQIAVRKPAPAAPASRAAQ